MRFLVDAQLPPALAHMLTDRGHTAEHVYEIGLGDAVDRAIWDYALEHDAALVTKDQDFYDMLTLSDASPVIVWVRVGNTRRQELLKWFQLLIDRIAELAATGNRLIELR